MSRIFARPFWLHLTIWWPIQTGSFSLIRKILHLCMRPSGAECCTPGETEHCSTADFSSVQSLQCCNAMFAVYLFSGSNRSDQCTLCYQVSESCIFCQLIGPLSRDSRFLLVSWSWLCVRSARVENVLSAPSPDQHSLSISLSLPTPYGHMKSDAWQKFRLWCAADMRAGPLLQHLSPAALQRHNYMSHTLLWEASQFVVRVKFTNLTCKKWLCLLKLYQPDY